MTHLINLLLQIEHYRQTMASSKQEQNVFLSCLLDDVTGTEEMMKIRRDYCMIDDCIKSSNPCKANFYYTGSKAEGLSLAGSDDDYMMDINNVRDIEVSESMQDLDQSTHKNKFLLVTDKVSPGFALLKSIDQLQDEYLLNAIVNNGDDAFLCSQYFISSSPALESEGDKRGIQGPSIEVKFEHQDASLAGIDNVLSIHCNVWPTSAAEWIDRHRQYEWPLLQDRENIAAFGCHLVPVGHLLSHMKSLEWRLSFSIAERMLVWSFNHTQMQCYAVMKLILKEFVKDNCSEANKAVLCSYFIKTFLFWQFENTDQAFWQIINLQECIMFLLHKFCECLKSGVLRHYFLPRFNLLEIKLTRDAQKELLQLHDIVIQRNIELFAHCASLSDVWNKLHNGLDKNQIETRNIQRLHLFESEKLMMCTLQKHHHLVRFAEKKSIRLGEALVGLEYLMCQGVTNTALPLMVIRLICSEIITNEMRSLIQGNKFQYSHLRALDNNVFGNDIASNKLLLATHLLKCKDNHTVLQTVNRILSSIPSCALYMTADIIYTGNDTMLLLDDLCRGYANREKEAWLFDLNIVGDDLACMPFAIQAEIVNSDPKIGIFISPFTYSYYLMFLCYHELGQFENRDRALCKLLDTINDHRRCSVMRHISYNIAGNCFLMVENSEMARELFVKSVQFTQQISPFVDLYNSAHHYLSNM